MAYQNEEEAFYRVEQIKRLHGAWPGVIRRAGGFELTYDPDEPLRRAAAEPSKESNDTATGDVQLHRVQPGDGHADQDFPGGAEMGQAS